MVEFVFVVMVVAWMVGLVAWVMALRAFLEMNRIARKGK